MVEPRLELINTPAWPIKELLAQEKTALGYYFSGHPYKAYKDDMAGIVDRALSQVAPQTRPQLMAGVIMDVRIQMGKKGKMAFVQLDDGTARLDVAVYPEQFETYRNLLKADNLLVIFGKVSHDDYSGGLRVVADEIYGLDQARNRFANRLNIRINEQTSVDGLRRMLMPYQAEGSGCPVCLHYQTVARMCEIHLGSVWRVRLEDTLMHELRECLGPENVGIQYGQ